MSWKCFELEYELKSPIHIGYGSKLGIIDRTRYYIPGKTLWGAVTAKLGEVMDNPNWEDLKNLVKENLIFSYFYIEDSDGKLLLPKQTDNGLKFGNLTPEKFEREYITSYASTAIDKNKGNAEDGSLHEIELIVDKIRDKEDFIPTKIGGYLFVREKTPDNQYKVTTKNNKVQISDKDTKEDLFEVIKNLQVGGERNYGYGKIRVPKEHKYKMKSDKIKLFGEYQVNLNARKPELEIKNSKEITALSHVIVENERGNENFDKLKNKLNKIKGDFEPLVGREWSDKKGPGQKTNFGGIALKPGSTFGLRDDGIKVIIGNYCVWEIESGEL